MGSRLQPKGIAGDVGRPLVQWPWLECSGSSIFSIGPLGWQMGLGLQVYPSLCVCWGCVHLFCQLQVRPLAALLGSQKFITSGNVVSHFPRTVSPKNVFFPEFIPALHKYYIFSLLVLFY